MNNFVTVDLQGLPPAASVSPDAVVAVQEPEGPLMKLKVGLLFGHVIAADTARDTLANLQLVVAEGANEIGLVFADPDPELSGWYRSTAAGAGNWEQFEKLSEHALAGVVSALESAVDAAALAGRYANDNTDADVVGGSSGERGAKWWNIKAEDNAGLAIEQVGLAVTAREGAETAAGGAEIALARAELSVTAAQAILDGDKKFDSFASGEAGTSAGEMFYVIVDGYPQFYINGTSSDADDIAFYTGPQYAAKTPTLLRATTRPFATGDILNTADGHRYEVVTTGEHLTTAGGVKLKVLPASDGALHSLAFGYEPSADNTAELTAFCVAIAGQKGVIDYAVADYRANYLTLYSDTLLVVGSGVYIKGLNDGSSNIFRTAAGATNILVSGYGATIELPASDKSHTFNMANYPENITIEGLKIIGPGLPNIHESDCIYVGGTPDSNLVAKNITIRDVVATNARRNILSIVAVDGILVDNCDLSGTLVGGTLRRIVDIEPNRWLANGDFACKNITFRKTKFHDSADGGLLITSGVNVTIEDCSVYDIVDYGIQIQQFSNVFDDGRNAPAERMLGVVSIDSATGWIEVGTTRDIIDDLNMRVGMWMTRITRDGGTWPTEIPSGYLVIEEISADQKKIRVSQSYGFEKITSTTGTGSAGTGSFDEDPTVAALYFGVYCWEDNVTIKNTQVDSTKSAVRATICSNIHVDGGVFKNSDTSPCIHSLYARQVLIDGGAEVLGDTALGRGIQFDRSTAGVIADGVIVRSFPKAGIYLGKASDAIVGVVNVQDCGKSETGVGSGASVMASKGVGYQISARVHSSETVRPARGIYLGSDTSYCLVDRANATGSADNNARSISDLGTNNRIVNSRLNDGTWAA